MKLRPRRDNESPQLVIIPMIDIIFFLLVFFMMSMLSMVVQKSIPVVLPVTQSAKLDVERKVPVTVTADGHVYVEQEGMNLDVFVRRMQLEKTRNEKVIIILRADKNVSYGAVVAVLDTLKKVGLKNVSIATEQ